MTEPPRAKIQPLDGPELLRLLVKRWWLTVTLVVVGAVAGVAYAHKQPAKYTASQAMVVSGMAPNPVVLSVTNESLDPARLVQTQVDILSGQAVKSAVSGRLARMNVSLEVDSSSDSNVVTVNAVASKATAAREALALAFAKYDAIQVSAENQELGSVQSTVRNELRGDMAELAETRNTLERSSLQQEIESLETTQAELNASVSAGKTTSQSIEGVHISGPTASPSEKEAGVIGAALGLVVASMLVVVTRKRAFKPL